MIISLNWIKKYFDKDLPAVPELENLITFHAFEVEGIESKPDDTVMDIKVLPDRMHYALSHRGIAREFSVITKLPFINKKAENILADNSVSPISVKIEAEKCTRYIGRKVSGIKIGPSPEWLKKSLESIGQRSINNIVDASNYVMFDIGQPLHAFDADKVVGGITVRMAKTGEKLVTLDNKDIALDESIMIIADDEGPLAIAGVKGGKKAEVDANTKNIILESANFNSTQIRRTSNKVGIKTDAVKRYENTVPNIITEEAMVAFSDLVSKVSPGAKFSTITDIGDKNNSTVTVNTTFSYLIERYGGEITNAEIVKILNSLDVTVKENGDQIELTSPSYRIDLNIADDYVDEIGRIHGYENVKAVKTDDLDRKVAVEPIMYISDAIRNILTGLGFSEVYLYSLVAKGDLEVAYPLAKDKSALRKNLEEGMIKSLEMNVNNAPLLGLDYVGLFEIGKVFTKDGEFLHLAISGSQIKKIKGVKSEDKIKLAIAEISKKFGSDIKGGIKNIGNNSIIEIDLTDILKNIKLPENYSELNYEKASQKKYTPVSNYPFMVRDIALFVGTESSEEVWNIIFNSIKESGADTLLRRHELFDVFKKKDETGKEITSYAFRMVFQSYEKTLSDEEINAVMDKIYKTVADRGFKVR